MWIEVGEEGSQNDPFVNYKLQIVIQFFVGVPCSWITDSCTVDQTRKEQSGNLNLTLIWNIL